MRPSGPRTTPGTKGSKLSKRSFTFGVFLTADSPTVLLPAASCVTTVSEVAVTFVDSDTVSTFISSSASNAVPAVMTTVWVAVM